MDSWRNKTDEILVEAIKAGDPEDESSAMDELKRRYEGKLLRDAIRILRDDAAVAADIVDQSFENAKSKIKTNQLRGRVIGLLSTTVHNKSVDVIRKREREWKYETDYYRETTIHTFEPRFEELDEWSHHVVFSAPICDCERVILNLRNAYGFTPAVTASLLGTSINTIYVSDSKGLIGVRNYANSDDYKIWKASHHHDDFFHSNESQQPKLTFEPFFKPEPPTLPPLIWEWLRLREEDVESLSKYLERERHKIWFGKHDPREMYRIAEPRRPRITIERFHKPRSPSLPPEIWKTLGLTQHEVDQEYEFSLLLHWPPRRHLLSENWCPYFLLTSRTELERQKKALKKLMPKSVKKDSRGNEYIDIYNLAKSRSFSEVLSDPDIEDLLIDLMPNEFLFRVEVDGDQIDLIPVSPISLYPRDHDLYSREFEGIFYPQQAFLINHSRKSQAIPILKMLSVSQPFDDPIELEANMHTDNVTDENRRNFLYAWYTSQLSLENERDFRALYGKLCQLNLMFSWFYQNRKQILYMLDHLFDDIFDEIKLD